MHGKVGSIMSLEKICLKLNLMFLISCAFGSILPPIIIQHPEDVALSTEELRTDEDQECYLFPPFTLHCKAEGEMVNYTWTKNGLPFDVTNNRFIEVANESNMRFKLPNDRAAGVYQCFARNTQGTAASNPAFVRKVWMEKMAPKIQRRFISSNQGHILPCIKINGWPQPQYYWVNDGVQTSENDYFQSITKNDKDDLVFSFVNLPKYDINKKIYKPTITDLPLFNMFTCIAKNDYYSQEVAKYSFEELDDRNYLYGIKKMVSDAKPRLLYVSSEQEYAIKNRGFDLFCIYSGIPLPQVAWYKNDEKLIVDSPRMVLDDSGKKLHFTDVYVTDQANYTCRVNFTFYGKWMNEEQSHSTYLFVNVVPTFKLKPTSLNITEGRTVYLTCIVNARPLPNITWSYNAEDLSYDAIHKSREYGIKSIKKEDYVESVLIIKQVNFDHIGNYACNASNHIGYVYDDFYVNVTPRSSARKYVALFAAVITFFSIYLIITCINRSHHKYKALLLSDGFVLDVESAETHHFDRKNLVLQNLIGSGNFGRVFIGDALLQRNDKQAKIKVAVKTTKENSTNNARLDLLHELSIMRKLGFHGNVIKLVGACTGQSPVYVIMELLSESLHQYLVTARTSRHYILPVEDSRSITSQKLMGFAKHIALGMEHVSSNGIVHRDLATRNILISEDFVCKIADFGLSRDISEKTIYVRHSNTPLPIRWMSPESLLAGQSSVQSDVWSFGVLLWELATLGATPYPDKNVGQVRQMICDGEVMERPTTSQSEFYDLMCECWQFKPVNRPGFSTCANTLEALFQNNKNYIRLENFPEHKYYHHTNVEGEIV